MLNYEVDPSILRPYVPTGTELDYHRGKCFVSIVAFQFLNTRVLGVPIPFHRNFEEINLRFYVRCESAGEFRRGVVFVREIVPRWAIATVAQWVYDEPYIARPTRHEIAYRPDELAVPASVKYLWKVSGEWCSASANSQGVATLPASGSQEEFITEHYWGYTHRRDGSTSEYEVEHPQWQLWQVGKTQLDCDVAALYGDEFAPFLAGDPDTAFLADGSEVCVRRGSRISGRLSGDRTGRGLSCGEDERDSG